MSYLPKPAPEEAIRLFEAASTMQQAVGSPDVYNNGFNLGLNIADEVDELPDGELPDVGRYLQWEKAVRQGDVTPDFCLGALNGVIAGLKSKEIRRAQS